MPRRVFTYPADLGLDALNLTSTIGAFILAAGIGVIFWDVVRPKGKEPYAPRNPWNAGTLEWLQEMPGKPWGIRSIPEIDSRYPLWDQPNFVRDVDEGRFYLPDAEELKRETLVTSVDRRQARAVPAAAGAVLHPALGRAHDRRLLHLRHVPLWWLALDQPGAGDRRHHVLAVDRHGDHPGEGREGRRPRPDAAALRLGPDVGRLVGDVHHDARRPHGVRVPRVRLLLLLDDPRRLSAEAAARSRRLLAGRGARVLAAAAWGADAPRAAPEQDGRRARLLRGHRWRPSRSPSRAARRCSPGRASPDSIRRPTSTPPPSGCCSSGPPGTWGSAS